MEGNKNKSSKTAFDRIDFLRIAEMMIHTTAPYKTYAHFRIDHTHRVYHIACSLAALYPENTFNYRNIGVMCAIHDMFKYATDMEHGEKAAKFLKELFIEEYYPEGHPSRKEWLDVVNAIKYHSLKDSNELPDKDNLYLQILMDADMLDKLHCAHIRALQRVFHSDLTYRQIMDMKMEENSAYIGKSLYYNTIKERILTETNTRLRF